MKSALFVSAVSAVLALSMATGAAAHGKKHHAVKYTEDDPRYMEDFQTPPQYVQPHRVYVTDDSDGYVLIPPRPEDAYPQSGRIPPRMPPFAFR